jgi:DNA (cytosine-5)-methyltransferase 1
VLVLSLFPGIGLLDQGFEEEGFCVVRGPDLLWGGDVRSFRPPAGKFAGVIGGPPCQAHSTYVHLNRARGNKVAEDLVPEYLRCVGLAQPDWWLMENVSGIGSVDLAGYVVTRQVVDARWLGMEQQRMRVFQFGTRSGAKLDLGPSLVALEAFHKETTCLAAEGAAGVIGHEKMKASGKSVATYKPRRSFERFCELQGLPADFLADAPFTQAAKYKVVGNGVPLAMGRAIAKAVKRATNLAELAA